MKHLIDTLINYSLLNKQRVLEIISNAFQKANIPHSQFIDNKNLSEDELLEKLISELTFGAHTKENKEHVSMLFIEKVSAETGISTKLIKAAIQRKREAKVERPVVSENSDLVFNFGNIDQDLTTDYAETFDDTKFRDLEDQFLKLEKLTLNDTDKAQADEYMRNIYRDMHSIKGTSRFISAELTEKIVHQSEDLLGFLQKFANKLSPDEFRKSVTLLMQAIDIAWRIREVIVSSNTEEPFWKDADSKKHYLAVLEQTKLFTEELTGRGYEVSIEDVESMF